MARPPARPLVTLCLLFATALLVPAVHATLGLEPSNIDLGKVDPGHRATRHVNITNTDAQDVAVKTEVQCGCGDYLTVDPEHFTLPAGERRQVRIDVAVADDAEPGIHDYQVRFVEVAAGGSGGTAQGAQGLGFRLEVRSAALFLTFQDAQKRTAYDLDADGGLAFRFVNAFESPLDVTVTGTVAHADTTRDIGPVTFRAPGGGTASAVYHSRIQTGLTADSEPAVYTVTLEADWTDADSGRSGPSIATVTVPVGAEASVDGFTATVDGDDVVFRGMLVNGGGTTLEARMVVEVREEGRPDLSRFESDPVRLEPGVRQEVSARWDDAAGAVYRATAFAAFQVAGDPGGATTEGPRTEEQVVTVDDGTGGGDGEDGAEGGSGTRTVLVAALVGVAIGGAIGFLVVRRKR